MCVCASLLSAASRSTGGFVDNGDTTKNTLQKEFEEEALRLEDMTPTEIDNMRADLRDLFTHGVLVAQIYSQDPRNTDNAWVETSAVMYHDETGNWTSKVKVNAGDDASKARWKMLHSGLKLYASHRALVHAVVKSKHAYW
jgi:hypothetical protein